MKKIFFRIICAILIILILLVLMFDIILVIESNKDQDKVPAVFGYKLFIVMTGSMQSKINVGDLVIVKEVDANTLKQNDIIAFKDSANLVTTHRIINIKEENGEKCFETKGDHNNIVDKDLVYPKDLEGKMVNCIPKLGEFILFVQKPLGLSLMILTILLIVAISFMMENEKARVEESKPSTIPYNNSVNEKKEDNSKAKEEEK